MWGKLGAGYHVPRRRGYVCTGVPPFTLSDKTSCVLAVSIFSWNWKERKFGGQATSPSSRCQHPRHVVRGCWRSPESQLLREEAQCSPPTCQHRRRAGWISELRGHTLGCGRGQSVPPFPGGAQGSAGALFGKEGKVKRRKTQFGLLKIGLW